MAQNQEYVTFKWFAKQLGVDKWRVYGWQSFIPIRTIRGVMMLSRSWAEEFIAKWKASLPPKDAAKLIGLPARGGSMSRYINAKRVETYKPFGEHGPRGQTRVIKSSIAGAKKKSATKGKKRRPPAVVNRSTKLFSLFETCQRLNLELPEVYQLLVAKKALKGQRVDGIWHVYEFSIVQYKAAPKRAA